MPITNPKLQNLILGYYACEARLYSDIVSQDPYFVAGLLPQAGQGYHNSAHVFSFSGKAKLSVIEALFATHHVPSSLYLDESLYRAKRDELLGRGYVNVEEESEYWWGIKSLDMMPSTLPQDVHVTRIDPACEKELELFLHLNKTINHLSDCEEHALRRHLSGALSSDEYALFIAYSANTPCGCAAVLNYNNVAYFCEAGVLTEYRRQGIHKTLSYERLHLCLASWNCSMAVIVTTHAALSNHTMRSMNAKLLITRHFMVKK